MVAPALVLDFLSLLRKGRVALTNSYRRCGRQRLVSYLRPKRPTQNPKLSSAIRRGGSRGLPWPAQDRRQRLSRSAAAAPVIRNCVVRRECDRRIENGIANDCARTMLIRVNPGSASAYACARGILFSKLGFPAKQSARNNAADVVPARTVTARLTRIVPPFSPTTYSVP